MTTIQKIEYWPPPAPAKLSFSKLCSLSSEKWEMELKKDGERWIVTRHFDGSLDVFNRHESPISRVDSELEGILKRLPPGSRLDAEYVRKGDEQILYVFDVLLWEGTPVYRNIYQDRRKYRTEVVRVLDSPRVFEILTRRTELAFEQQYLEWKESDILNAEGVVLKRRLSRYTRMLQPDSVCRDWRKRRFSWDDGLSTAL